MITIDPQGNSVSIPVDINPGNGRMSIKDPSGPNRSNIINDVSRSEEYNHLDRSRNGDFVFNQKTKDFFMKATLEALGYGGVSVSGDKHTEVSEVAHSN